MSLDDSLLEQKITSVVERLLASKNESSSSTPTSARTPKTPKTPKAPRAPKAPKASKASSDHVFQSDDPDVVAIYRMAHCASKRVANIPQFLALTDAEATGVIEDVVRTLSFMGAFQSLSKFRAVFAEGVTGFTLFQRNPFALVHYHAILAYLNDTRCQLKNHSLIRRPMREEAVYNALVEAEGILRAGGNLVYTHKPEVWGAYMGAEAAPKPKRAPSAPKKRRAPTKKKGTRFTLGADEEVDVASDVGEEDPEAEMEGEDVASDVAEEDPEAQMEGEDVASDVGEEDDFFHVDEEEPIGLDVAAAAEGAAAEGAEDPEALLEGEDEEPEEVPTQVPMEPTEPEESDEIPTATQVLTEPEEVPTEPEEVPTETQVPLELPPFPTLITDPMFDAAGVDILSPPTQPQQQAFVMERTVVAAAAEEARVEIAARVETRVHDLKRKAPSGPEVEAEAPAAKRPVPTMRVFPWEALDVDMSASVRMPDGKELSYTEWRGKFERKVPELARYAEFVLGGKWVSVRQHHRDVVFAGGAPSGSDVEIERKFCMKKMVSRFNRK